MSNPLFEAVINEEAPMYDAAIISEKGVEIWKNPVSNNANNGHSTTKLIIATAVGMLCDRGLLSPDDAVTAFFSQKEMGDAADKCWQNVKVRHLLQHKTGIEHIPYGIDDADDTRKIGSDFLKYIFSIKIEHEPGTFYKYSDEAFYLLGRIINKVSGESTVEFLRKNLFEPLSFSQWAMATCPGGHPICGGGFFARSEDTAKIGYMYACSGLYNGKRMLSREWIEEAMRFDYALTEFRSSGVFLKTGARGQIIAFSPEKKVAVSWHGCSAPDDNGKRNDRLLEAFVKTLELNF